MSNKVNKMTTIGERLKAFREELGLNQIEFSSRTKINRTYMSDVESGRREPSKNFMDSLNKTFGISYNWLLTGEGPMFLSSPDRVASESPEAKEASLAVNALRNDILAQKIVLMLREVDEEGRREILAYAEKAKQATDKEKQAKEEREALKAQVKELKDLVEKRAG